MNNFAYLFYSIASRIPPGRIQGGGSRIRTTWHMIEERGLKIASLWLKMSCSMEEVSQQGLRMTRYGPKMAQDEPKMAQDGPKMAQDGPKMAQDEPKMAQDGPKMGPRWA